MIEQQEVGPNVAVYIGHSALRTYVMGADATTRAANDDEIDAMRGLVAEAMNVGALGFSSSTHEQHVAWGGVPMPSRLADDREFKAIAATVGAAGRGTLILVKGSRSDEHTSALQSLMRISYAVFCLKTKTIIHLIIS